MPNGTWSGFPICLYNVGHKLVGNAPCGSLPMKEQVKFLTVGWHTQQATANTCLNRCLCKFTGEGSNTLSFTYPNC